MTMTSSSASPQRRRSLGFARILNAGVAHLRDRARIRREMAALSDLSDHLLRDMGLERPVDRRIHHLPPRWR